MNTQENDREERQESSVAYLVSRFAAFIRGDGALSTGDIAALRRMDPWHPPAAFFKVEGLVREGEPDGQASSSIERDARWAAIVAGLAHLGPLHRDARQDYGLALGRVLGEAQYAEQRFGRLLQADAHRLIDELPMLARYLSAKSLPVDWTGAAHLLLSSGGKHETRVRRSLARDYYGLLARQEATSMLRQGDQ